MVVYVFQDFLPEWRHHSRDQPSNRSPSPLTSSARGNRQSAALADVPGSVEPPEGFRAKKKHVKEHGRYRREICIHICVYMITLYYLLIPKIVGCPASNVCVWLSRFICDLPVICLSNREPTPSYQVRSVWFPISQVAGRLCRYHFFYPPRSGKDTYFH